MAQTKIKAGLFEGIIGNGTDGYFLMSNGDGTMTWSPTITPPTITSIAYPGSVTAADPAGGETITVTGSDFNPGVAVTIGGTTATTVSYISATEITFTTPVKTAGDYDIVITNTDGGTATSINGISYNGVPAWTTPAGSLGSFASDTTISTITLQAAEPDAGTITFSITNGALPTGLSLTGADIDGTTSIVNADTTYNFTITAVDDESQSTGRAFSITIEKYILVSSEHFTINTYTGNGSTQSIEGRIGTVASFNGSSSQIDLNYASLGMGVNDFSYSFWFKTNNTTANQTFMQVLSEHINYGIRINDSAGYLGSYPTNSSGGAQYIGATVTIDTDWHHVAYIKSSTTGVGHALYYDGTKIAEDTSFTGNVQTSTDNKTTFGSATNDINWFDGNLDQVRFFNKALSSSEVTTLYGENNTSTTKSTTDIFGDGSGVGLYEFEKGAKSGGAKKHYIHIGDAGNQTTSVRINTVDADFTYTRPDGYAEWGGSFDPNNTAYGYLGSSSNITFSSNNKLWEKTQGNYYHAAWSTNGYSSGKYYVELEFLSPDLLFGLSTLETADTANSGASFYENAISYFSYAANKRIYSFTSVSGGAVLATNDVIGFAVDFDNKTLKYYINNTLVETETLAGYDGTPTDVSFVGTSFQPDLVWLKSRGSVRNHMLSTSVQQQYNYLSTNLTNAEATSSARITSLDSNGFTIGTSANVNENNIGFAAWCWKAGGVPTPNNNTNGTITSTVSANPTAGFSIVKYTSTGTNGSTIGHGLSSAPDLVIIKSTTDASNWIVYNSASGTSKYMYLNSTSGEQTGSWFGTSATTFTLNNTYSDANTNGRDYIAYCFHSVDGYQKVGSYTGNGSSGGQTITGLGFNPRFLLVKNTTSSAGWRITDSVRGDNIYLYPNLTNADDSSSGYISLITDGFRLNGLDSNTSDTFIYLAIA